MRKILTRFALRREFGKTDLQHDQGLFVLGILEQCTQFPTLIIVCASGLKNLALLSIREMRSPAEGGRIISTQFQLLQAKSPDGNGKSGKIVLRFSG
jgi:hypothetical protein